MDKHFTQMAEEYNNNIISTKLIVRVLGKVKNKISFYLDFMVFELWGAMEFHKCNCKNIFFSNLLLIFVEISHFVESSPETDSSSEEEEEEEVPRGSLRRRLRNQNDSRRVQVKYHLRQNKPAVDRFQAAGTMKYDF